jgi:hypothetical protein
MAESCRLADLNLYASTSNWYRTPLSNRRYSSACFIFGRAATVTQAPLSLAQFQYSEIAEGFESIFVAR